MDNSEFYVRLGALLKEKRRSLGYGQEQVADMIEVSRFTMINIESGEHSTPLHTVLKLASILSIDLSEIKRLYDKFNFEQAVSREPEHLQSIIRGLVDHVQAISGPELTYEGTTGVTGPTGPIGASPKTLASGLWSDRPVSGLFNGMVYFVTDDSPAQPFKPYWYRETGVGTKWFDVNGVEHV